MEGSEIKIIAGLESYVLGMNEKGQKASVGGWGHFCGDEGSAYWIGKKGIEAFAKQADGRHEKGVLYELIREALFLAEDSDLILYIHDEIEFSKEEIAVMAELVKHAAKMGDRDAAGVLKKAAEELVLMIKGLKNKIELSEPLSISCEGNVFTAGEFIMEPLKNELNSLKIDYKLLCEK